jgi:hypothetical protein
LFIYLFHCNFHSNNAHAFVDPAMLRRLKELEQEVDDSRYVLPPRYLDPVKRASVLLLHCDGDPCGVGFFVSPNIVVTANHNITSYPDSATIVRVKLFIDGEQFVSSTLSVKGRHPDYDLAVLYTSTAHEPFLNIADGDSIIDGSNRLAVTTFGIALTAAFADIQFSGEGFAVIPAQIFRKSNNHIVYFSNVFSGDSGGAVLFSPSGEVLALHLETVNQASEELEHGFYNLEDVANSVNSVIKGFSQGFVGLRLDSHSVRNLIFL